MENSIAVKKKKIFLYSYDLTIPYVRTNPGHVSGSYLKTNQTKLEMFIYNYSANPNTKIYCLCVYIFPIHIVFKDIDFPASGRFQVVFLSATSKHSVKNVYKVFLSHLYA